MPELSIAHTEAGAAAIAADVPVGIDIEPATANTPEILSSFATEAEIGLIEELVDASPDSGGQTRLWCAKEAAAKALGTGLQGRPKDFEALAVEEDGSFLVQHGPTGERLAVYTVQVGSFIVACCAGTEQMANDRCKPAGLALTSRLAPAVRP